MTTGIISKFEASLTDDTRIVIYDHHMFIEQATDWKQICVKPL